MNHLAARIQTIIQEMPGKDRGKQTELARIAGASKQVVNHWLTGVTTTMDYGYATMIHKALGYRLDWLMRGKGPKRDDEQDAVAAEAEPTSIPNASPTGEQQPAQNLELFLVHVTLDELRVLSSYRKRQGYRPMFNEMAKVIATTPDA
jgi:transcriptional regulator with XRE-family HTH domain